MLELLSYAGRVTEEDVSSLADVCKQRKRESETDVGQCDQVKKRRAQKAKDALRRAKSLQRRLEQKKVHLNQLYGCEWKMLRDLEDGSLLATVNLRVREEGRGRLRRARPASVVAEVLDGPQKRPRTDSFTHRRCF